MQEEPEDVNEEEPNADGEAPTTQDGERLAQQNAASDPTPAEQETEAHAAIDEASG